MIILKLESVYDPANLILKYFKVLNYSPYVNGYFLPVMMQKKLINNFSLFKASASVTTLVAVQLKIIKIKCFWQCKDSTEGSNVSYFTSYNQIKKCPYAQLKTVPMLTGDPST